MANVKPQYITGATIYVKVNEKRMGYTNSISYVAEITTIPVEPLGMYNVAANEPIAFSVRGSFSINRYAALDSNAATVVNTGAPKSNSPGIWGNSQMNPSQMLNSATFDIEIFNSKGDDTDYHAKANNDITTPLADATSIIKITDCRITRRSGGLTKRGIYEETFQFIGRLLNDDSKTTSISINNIPDSV